MKCLIVDDEPLAGAGMELNIGDMPSLELVGQCNNAVATNDFSQSNTVDLMFLDIEMPGTNGLGFIRSLKYIKGLKDYVMLYTEKEKIMTAMNIKTINSQLPDSIFVRVSKSYIININFIDSIDIDFIHLGSEEIPLGRTYRDRFIQNYV